MRKSEEVIGRKVSGSYLENGLTAVGIRCANQATFSIRKIGTITPTAAVDKSV
jgi:hypothetical protein